MKFDPTLLIRPATYGPLVAVLRGLHCIYVAFGAMRLFIWFSPSVMDVIMWLTCDYV